MNDSELVRIVQKELDVLISNVQEEATSKSQEYFALLKAIEYLNARRVVVDHERYTK